MIFIPKKECDRLLYNGSRIEKMQEFSESERRGLLSSYSPQEKTNEPRICVKQLKLAK
jgi:hypothetical protein